MIDLFYKVRNIINHIYYLLLTQLIRYQSNYMRKFPNSGEKDGILGLAQAYIQ